MIFSFCPKDFMQSLQSQVQRKAKAEKPASKVAVRTRSKKISSGSPFRAHNFGHLLFQRKLPIYSIDFETFESAAKFQSSAIKFIFNDPYRSLTQKI